MGELIRKMEESSAQEKDNSSKDNGEGAGGSSWSPLQKEDVALHPIFCHAQTNENLIGFELSKEEDNVWN